MNQLDWSRNNRINAYERKVYTEGKQWSTCPSIVRLHTFISFYTMQLKRMGIQGKFLNAKFFVACRLSSFSLAILLCRVFPLISLTVVAVGMSLTVSVLLTQVLLAVRGNVQ